jgi:hypothetical protein
MITSQHHLQKILGRSPYIQYMKKAGMQPRNEHTQKNPFKKATFGNENGKKSMQATKTSPF